MGLPLRASRACLALPGLLVALFSQVVACGSNAEPRPATQEEEPTEEEADEEPAAAGRLQGGNKSSSGTKSSLGTCAQSATAMKKDLSNVLFLIDRSGSMHIRLSSGGTRWTDTKSGLATFLQSLSNTTRAGAMMFPQGNAPVDFCYIDAGINDVVCRQGPARPDAAPRCDASNYSLGVPIGPMDNGKRTAIMQHIASSDEEFYYGTPIAPALRGAIDQLRASPLDGAKSVVLLTDGYPTACTNKSGGRDEPQPAYDAALYGVAGGSLVRTFVMGVIDGTKGADASVLRQIAVAGGTDHHYEINEATFAQDMARALGDIGLQAFDCTFSLPDTNGRVLDKDSVNVEVYGQSQRVVPRDTSRKNGWDYLPGDKQIQFYGEACKALQTETQVRVDIVVGCKTVIR